jgi:hypothetical protein
MACDYNRSFKRNFNNKVFDLQESGITGVAMLPQIFDFLKSV